MTLYEIGSLLLHPFGRAKPRLWRRGEEARLRVNLEPLGLSSGRGQASRIQAGRPKGSLDKFIITFESNVKEIYKMAFRKW